MSLHTRLLNLIRPSVQADHQQTINVTGQSGPLTSDQAKTFALDLENGERRAKKFAIQGHRAANALLYSQHKGNVTEQKKRYSQEKEDYKNALDEIDRIKRSPHPEGDLPEMSAGTKWQQRLKLFGAGFISLAGTYIISNIFVGSEIPPFDEHPERAFWSALSTTLPIVVLLDSFILSASEPTSRKKPFLVATAATGLLCSIAALLIWSNSAPPFTAADVVANEPSPGGIPFLNPEFWYEGSGWLTALVVLAEASATSLLFAFYLRTRANHRQLEYEDLQEYKDAVVHRDTALANMGIIKSDISGSKGFLKELKNTEKMTGEGALMQIQANQAYMKALKSGLPNMS